MTTATSATTQQDNPDEYLVIDWALSLKLANNKVSLAEELLTMYINELPASRDTINQVHQQNDMTQLRNHVHKLHGASCYCGVPKLKSLAATLETALKKKQFNQIESLINQLNDEIDAVLTTYAAQDFRYDS